MSAIHDVFLSYNNKDKTFVLELANALKASGVEPWLDEWELVPGRPWQQALEQIIEHTRAVAILVGDEGLGPWEIVETRALLVQFVERGLPVIPVLLPRKNTKLELPIFLSAFTWVDLHEGITPEGLNRLIWGITGTKPSHSVNVSTGHLNDAKSTVQENKKKTFDDHLLLNESLEKETNTDILLAALRRLQQEDSALFLRRKIEDESSLYSRLEKVEECLFERYLEHLAVNCTVYEAVLHYRKLETYISKIATSALKDSFSPCEAFILLVGIYLKDLGLSLCYSDLYKYPLDEHHIVGYELFLESYPEFGLSKELALTIAPLIRAHRVIPLSELSLETAFGNEIIRTRLLCALLRLGDFLDFPSGKMSMTALNVGAIIKYAAVTGIQIDQHSWRIRISGTASSLQESEFLLNLWFNLQNVLDSVRETLERYGLHYQVIEVDSNALRPYFFSRNITKDLQKQFIDPNIGNLSEADFYSYVVRTPLLNSKIVDLELGGSIHFKCESAQETGSFKFRGAISLIANASDIEKERGVFLASSGNFAIAAITACKIFNVRVTHILVPLQGDNEKLEFIRRFSDAEVIFFQTEEEKQNLINTITSKFNSVFISGCDKRAQRGYETIVSEIYYKNDFDALLIPVGEGALLGACSAISRRINPHVRIIGCEPASRNDAYQSFRRGELTLGAKEKTIADGLMANLTASTFPAIIENADDILTVEEKEIEAGVDYLLERLTLSVEPSAAVTMAALLNNRRRFYNKKICVLLTGQNNKNIRASKFLMK